MNTNRLSRRRIQLVCLGFFLLALVPAWSLPYTVGKYTVTVDVRNSALALIPDARVTCRITGKTLNIEARAPGYVGQTYAQAISEQCTSYKHDFTLADVGKKFVIMDLTGRVVESAHIEAGQYGFPAQQYGLTILVPVSSWPRPTAANIDVMDPNWLIPLKTTCKVAKREDFFEVRVALSRQTMDLCGPQLIVTVDTTASLTEGQVLRWVNALIKVENLVNPPAGAAMALAKFLYYTLSERQVVATGRVPKTLQALYDRNRAFSQLHRDLEEKDQPNP